MFQGRVPSSGLLLGSLFLLWFAGMRVAALAGEEPSTGLASWYGEERRGKVMANGKRFDPEKFTAASWFYPLGTKVRVSVASPSQPRASVVVTITDRGPAKHLVRDGRIIDLSHASFKQLGAPEVGLLAVTVLPVESDSKASTPPTEAQAIPRNDALPLPAASPSSGSHSNDFIAAAGTDSR